MLVNLPKGSTFPWHACHEMMRWRQALDRASFIRLLGPVQETMSKGLVAYNLDK